MSHVAIHTHSYSHYNATLANKPCSCCHEVE